MASAISLERMRQYRPGPAGQLLIGLSSALALALAFIGPDKLIAQIEGDRGIPPIASSTDIQVGGIEVNVTADTGEEARLEGWKIAQRKAWEKVGGPKMSDGQIESMVSAVVIEHEQVGPRRYVAKLGVIFDRTKAGSYLVKAEGGVARSHSAPLLVIPVLYSGGARQVFEVKGPWQKAWANFQTAASPIDYVRPVGSGGESLILTAGQPGRRSRTWWRTILDQFGAADVITPVARLERQWPGGPVRGTFTARYGPDNRYLDSFTLTANDEAGVPAMLDKALVKLDLIYRDALARGLLKPDPTLLAEQAAFDAALAALRSALLADAPKPKEETSSNSSASSGDAAPPTAKPTISTITVQFDSPDAAAVDSALSSVRGASGVQGAATTSIAIGGTSVMRVTMSGDIEALASALRSRGWQVVVGNGALSIRR
ncbi:MAG: heavy-metal-associated domain-containing protein [Novosphingobium sp.]|nr:heavy-metal-associated domain-containing protein [Novosphingobium sp.]